MGIKPLSHARLMQESEQQVQDAAQRGSPRQQITARRLIEDTGAWRIWESEHDRLMRKVAAAHRASGQTAALKATSFALIQRKALFEYLSERKIRGDARRHVLSIFYGSRAYTDSVIAEHGNYIRASCSYLCSTHIGTVIILDGAFQDPMTRYEELFREYFRTFCDVSLGGTAEDASLRPLLPYLKHQVNELRDAILAMPRSLPDLMREAQIRRPTGDTVRIEKPPVRG